jgi:LysM repeat protein
MAARNPARFLAPLALVAFAFALVVVVQSSVRDAGDAGGTGATTTEQQTATPDTGSTEQPASGNDSKGPRFYRVKPGDTPSAIAQATGVPLSQIQELNPDLDPQTLAPGQRIKLRK